MFVQGCTNLVFHLDPSLSSVNRARVRTRVCITLHVDDLKSALTLFHSVLGSGPSMIPIRLPHLRGWVGEEVAATALRTCFGSSSPITVVAARVCVRICIIDDLQSFHTLFRFILRSRPSMISIRVPHLLPLLLYKPSTQQQ